MHWGGGGDVTSSYLTTMIARDFQTHSSSSPISLNQFPSTLKISSKNPHATSINISSFLSFPFFRKEKEREKCVCETEREGERREGRKKILL